MSDFSREIPAGLIKPRRLPRAYTLTSIESYPFRDSGTVYVVASPVSAERTFPAMLEALGDSVTIDGVEYRPRGFDWHPILTPVQVGEKIGILT